MLQNSSPELHLNGNSLGTLFIFLLIIYLLCSVDICSALYIYLLSSVLSLLVHSMLAEHIMLLQPSFERGKRNICSRNRGRRNIFQFFFRSKSESGLFWCYIYSNVTVDADEEDDWCAAVNN